jgi:hypothetical protein
VSPANLGVEREQSWHYRSVCRWRLPTIENGAYRTRFRTRLCGFMQVILDSGKRCSSSARVDARP